MRIRKVQKSSCSWPTRQELWIFYWNFSLSSGICNVVKVNDFDLKFCPKMASMIVIILLNFQFKQLFRYGNTTLVYNAAICGMYEQNCWFLKMQYLHNWAILWDEIFTVLWQSMRLSLDKISGQNHSLWLHCIFRWID